MAVQNGAPGPDTLFSEGTTAGRTDSKTPGNSDGCIYETPEGRCGDTGTVQEVGGFRLELCGEHLEAVLEENGIEVAA